MSTGKEKPLSIRKQGLIWDLETDGCQSAFVDDEVLPIIEECHREARTPLELVPAMASLDLFGANLDDYESHDERLLMRRTCFSVEPGVYVTDDFGVRSEIDMLMNL